MFYFNELFCTWYTLIVADYWLSRRMAISYERRVECMRGIVSWEKFDEVSARRRARSQAGSSCVMKSAWSSKRDMMEEGLILRALDSRAAASARCNLCTVFAIHTRGERERRLGANPQGTYVSARVLNKFQFKGMGGWTGYVSPRIHPPLRLTSYWYPLPRAGPRIPFSNLVETWSNPLCPVPPFAASNSGHSKPLQNPLVRGISHMWRTR